MQVFALAHGSEKMNMPELVMPRWLIPMSLRRGSLVRIYASFKGTETSSMALCPSVGGVVGGGGGIWEPDLFFPKHLKAMGSQGSRGGSEQLSGRVASLTWTQIVTTKDVG